MKPMKAIAALFLVWALCSAQKSIASQVIFDGGARAVTVEVADTPQKRTLGLMYRRPLTEDRGMWFVFPQEEALVFWMKNVSFPIDIIFIDKSLTIRYIWKSVPPCASEPCPRYPSNAPAQYVLEVISGFCEKYGIRENQKVLVTR